MLSDSRPKQYHRTKLQLFFVSVLVDTIFLAGTYFFSASNLLWSVTQQILLFLASYFMLNSLVMLPLDFVRGYTLEKKYKLSTQSLISWWIYFLISMVLSLVFFLIIYGFFYWLVHRAGDAWWVWAATLGLLFSIILNIIFPILLIPLFYKIHPLQDPAVTDSMRDLCMRCHTKPMKAYIIKLSKKTVRANAAVVGFGRSRRILLSDTLMSFFSPEEIRMVVAHEIGHHALWHMGKMTLFSAAISCVGLYLVQLFIPSAILGNPIYFPIILVASRLTQIAVAPIVCAYSRSHEKEADSYALSLYPDLSVFESLMNGLSEKNLSDPNPSALEEWFFYTHPSAKNRIRSATKFLLNATHASRPSF